MGTYLEVEAVFLDSFTNRDPRHDLAVGQHREAPRPLSTGGNPVRFEKDTRAVPGHAAVGGAVQLDNAVGALARRTVTACTKKRVVRQSDNIRQRNIFTDPVWFRIDMNNAVVENVQNSHASFLTEPALR